MTALFLGSISTLADTSELQREAFNEAFRRHDLDWSWDREEYQSKLDEAGGRQRIADEASSKGVEVDADAIHATKSEIFQERLASQGVEARPGVAETIQAARDAGDSVALVTTTSRANVDALLGALSPQLGADRFDLIVSADDDVAPKPHPAAYELALERLYLSADDVIAVEDNVDGVGAATAAGLRCVATPNENTAGHDFAAADSVADQLEPALVA